MRSMEDIYGKSHLYNSICNSCADLHACFGACDDKSKCDDYRKYGVRQDLFLDRFKEKANLKLADMKVTMTDNGPMFSCYEVVDMINNLV